MTSKSCAVVVNNNHTDIVVNVYSNRILVIVSQYKKLGSIVSINKEAVIREFGDDIFSTRVIFGKDEPEIHASARFIAEQLNCGKPLLVSVCLKDFEPSCLRTVVKAIKKIAPEIVEQS